MKPNPSVSAELEQIARDLLEKKLALCTEKQRATFKLCFPTGVPTFRLESAIDLVNRTLRENNK